jgi:hypothetical protein
MANQAKFDRSAVSFSLKETNKGYFQFALSETGKYGLDDVADVLAALAKNPDETLNQFQLWLDWEDAPVQKAPVKFDAVVKFAKAKGTTAQMVMTRRPFPQVKIKLSRGEGRKSSSSKLREL